MALEKPKHVAIKYTIKYHKCSLTDCSSFSIVASSFHAWICRLIHMCGRWCALLWLL